MNLKKYTVAIFMLVVLLSAAACRCKAKIALPDFKDVNKIEFSESGSQNSCICTDEKEISKLMDDLKNYSKNSFVESVSDEPVNVDEYITMKIYYKISGNNSEVASEDNSSVAYLYRKNGRSYIEQPYSGIWELKNEIFDEINEQVKAQ